jgi:glycosyltransferase involved in cell wall biosynthesis
MLSILIPTYNQNITRLVAELHRQAMQQQVEFELLVMEDGSNKEVAANQSINELGCCRHIVLTGNIGRSAVRNKLADEAKYDHLLFMDCDAEVCSPHFIEKYLTFCKEECIVIGGTVYDPHENNRNYSLRLTYGRQREARTAIERGRNNFATFNFLISKPVFNRVRFDESIRGYGHEDMLFGHQLHQLGYEFTQIENPLIHKGLDDNTTFICKTEEGTRNLFLLYKTGRYPFLAKESKLLKTFLRIHKLGLARLLALKYDLTKDLFRWFLCRKSPSLLFYDLYKILFMCKTSLKK